MGGFIQIEVNNDQSYAMATLLLDGRSGKEGYVFWGPKKKKAKEILFYFVSKMYFIVYK